MRVDTCFRCRSGFQNDLPILYEQQDLFPERRKWKKKKKRTLILILILSFLIFVAQNARVVSVSFLFWKAEASQVLVLMGTFIIGFLAGWLLGGPAGKNKRVKDVVNR